MLYALILTVCSSAVTVLALIGVNDRQRRAHARREDLLMNQILYVSGKTWQEPPHQAKPQVAERPHLVSSPEQLA